MKRKMLQVSKINLVPDWYYKDSDCLALPGVEVYLNGVKAEVHSSRESAVPFNRIWPGRQRSLDQTELAGFVNFASDESVEVKVVINNEWEFDKAVIRPLSKNVKTQVNGREVTLTLTEPGQYALELGTYHQLIDLFFDPVTPEIKAEDVDYYFGPGVHFPGVINLKSGDKVYIDRQAVVFGNIFGRGVRDIHIFGGGILNGAAENRIFGGFIEVFCKSTIKFYNSDHIRIEDIIVQDSSQWTTSFFSCSDIVINRLKVVGQWRYNPDGVDFCNSNHIKITDSFVRAFDDGLVFKGYDSMPFYTVPEIRREMSVTDIEVRNCTVWCGWGRTLEVGVETCAPEYKNLLFENCDLIHNSTSSLSVKNGNNATIHDVTFRNIRIEYQTETLPEIYQRSEDAVYDNQGVMGVPRIIAIANARYGGQTGKFGDTFDILFEEIKVLAEEGVPEKLPVYFGNFSDDVKVADITIRNLTVNDRKITSADDVDLKVIGKVDNVKWE